MTLDRALKKAAQTGAIVKSPDGRWFQSVPDEESSCGFSLAYTAIEGGRLASYSDALARSDKWDVGLPGIPQPVPLAKQ